MPHAHSLYQRTIQEQYGFSATWTPGVQLALGDVGRIEDGGFVRDTTLGALGVEFEARPEHGNRESLSYASSDAVELRLEGSAGAQAGAIKGAGDLVVRIAEASGFVVALDGLEHVAIADSVAVEREVLQLYRRETWELEWSVVSHVVRARAATILIAGEGGGEARLSASTSLPPILSSLTDLKAKVGLVASHGLAATVVAEGALTPLFRARRLRRRLFARPHLRFGTDRQEDARPPADTLEWSELQIVP